MKSKRKLCSMHSASKSLMVTSSESGMDKKTGELILEYVLRQCDKDFIISGLIKALPVSNENLRLKKMILLKSISLDLSKRILSEKTLETLQSLKDLNMQISRDSNIEKSMQDLCCKVAVECTVKCLRGTCKINWDDYNDALRKLWTFRAEDTEDVEMDGEVIDVKKELLTVASNHTLRESLLEKYKQDDVLKCLDAFLKDSWEEMGPSLLEIALEEVAQGSYNLIAGQDWNRGAITDRMAAPSCETGDPACIVPDNDEETTSTFPPPWAGSDMNRDKNLMVHNLDENQTILSKTREAGNSSVQHLSGREFPVRQPILIDPVRKDATAAQGRGIERPDMSRDKNLMVHNLNENQAIFSKTREAGNSSGQHLSGRKFPVRQPIIIDPVRKEPTAAEERGEENFHTSAGSDLSKDKKIMAHNLNENQTILSNTREAGNSSGHALSDRKFPDCQPIVVDLEETEVPRHDDPVRKEATAAQKRAKESEFNLNDVNTHKSPRLRTDYIDIKGLTTPEYDRVKENLRRSNLELHSLVEDPLPNSLKVAESCAVREDCFPSAVHLDGKKQLEKKNDEVEKTIMLENNTGLHNQAQHQQERQNRNQHGKSGVRPEKFNIMDRNPTARTFEWEEQDTIDSEQDKSPSDSRNIRLPTPVRKHVSPLKRLRTSVNISYRRKPTKWSLVEEETLRKEVAKYGKGRWKYILEKNRAIFEERTEVDLKDKWRNIERREGLHGP